MARKTKEDAEITRLRILDAAREVFLVHGVSRTSMEQIASHADLTRGAIYWHFKNKSEIFHAIRDQVFLPLIDRMDDTLSIELNADPLMQIEKTMCDTVHDLDNNLQMRQIYEIMMIKCEYVDEFATVLQEILNNCSSITEKIQASYERAKAQGILNSVLQPRDLALDTHLFFSGLLHMWVKDADGTRFRFQAETLIKMHIQLRRK